MHNQERRPLNKTFEGRRTPEAAEQVIQEIKAYYTQRPVGTLEFGAFGDRIAELNVEAHSLEGADLDTPATLGHMDQMMQNMMIVREIERKRDWVPGYESAFNKATAFGSRLYHAYNTINDETFSNSLARATLAEIRDDIRSLPPRQEPSQPSAEK